MNIKYYVMGFFIISTFVLGYLYKESLKEIGQLKGELEKVVTETNEYKDKTDALITRYSDDMLKWQDKVADARTDCDKRIKLYRKAESEVPDNTVINAKTSELYVKEINSKLRKKSEKGEKK